MVNFEYKMGMYVCMYAKCIYVSLNIDITYSKMIRFWQAFT